MAAVVCTLAILFFLGRVLLHVPAPIRQSREPAAIQISFVSRSVSEPSMLLPPEPANAPTPRHSRNPPGARAPTAPPSARADAPVAAARAQGAMAAQLYSRTGQVQLPPGASIDPLDPGHAAVPPGMTDQRELDRARKVMERPNPVDYRETRFAKDWKSDGTLGDVAVQGLNRGMKRANRAIFGDDVQNAKARPPPDVRFNPALAQNAGELGSEATGDAYKAAPIAHEPPPDLTGTGSRNLRAELAQLEPTLARCDSARRLALLAPIRTHLADLERVERAMTHGADPVMAAQMLPRQGDSAYDLTRRALWYARKQAARCAG